MTPGEERSPPPGHDVVRNQYDDVQSDGRYEEGMARMALYHRHCQDPVIFRALGDVRGKSLLDLACGDGFYTRRFRVECGASPVMGIDLSPRSIEKAKAIEERAPLGIEYVAADVTEVDLKRRFEVVTAIHLLHYLENEQEIESLLRKIRDLLDDGGRFITMIANPEFDLAKHDPSDSKAKFGYYFSRADPGNGGLFHFHPGGFPKERELTFALRRWERGFIDEIAERVGLRPDWHEPFISAAGLEEHGASFFDNYLANPQSKLLRLIKL